MTTPWLKLLQSLKTHPLVDPSISKKYFAQLDLSVSNKELKKVNVNSSTDLEAYILGYMQRCKAKVAYGGYLEKRNIYNRSIHFHQDNTQAQRNIHLGLDVWMQAGTPVYAPIDAEIHSFRNNINHGDYGPTIILEHNIKGFQFYTLYGHLSLISLQDKYVGKKVLQGDQIATLGTSEINGDYPPHLYFQIIKDLQGYEGDYPGVCSEMEVEFYKSNCPNPSLLFNF